MLRSVKRKWIDRFPGKEDDSSGNGKEDHKKLKTTWHEDLLYSDTYEEKLEAVVRLKNILTEEKGYESHKDVIRKTTIAELMVFLLFDHIQPELQHETACALGNLSSWTCDGFVDEIERFVDLSRSQDDILSREAFQVLGELARKSFLCRREMFLRGAIDSALTQLDTHTESDKLRNVTKTLSFMCHDVPSVFGDQLVKIAVEKFKSVMDSSTDWQTLFWLCCSLCYLSKGTDDVMQVLIDMNVCERLVGLLRHDNLEVVESALSAVESIVGRDHKQIEVHHKRLIEALCGILRKPGCHFLSEALNSLFSIICAAKVNKDKYMLWTLDAGVLPRIRGLKGHKDGEISNGATRLLELFPGQGGKNLRRKVGHLGLKVLKTQFEVSEPTQRRSAVFTEQNKMAIIGLSERPFV